jgi:ABC-2 type transport system permease protein
MAVHRRGYRQYDGARSPERWRFWILSRYALNRAFQSRILIVFYLLCFIPTLFALAGVYLSHHVDLLRSLFPNESDFRGNRELFPMSEYVFLALMSFQATLSVFVTALVGPSLVSPDLTNNALPLYFSRPFSRVEYILGKFSVLFVLLSLITTAPMLLIYLFKSALAGFSWFTGNIHMAVAITIGSCVWVMMISLVAMASSAWLRWRPAAAGMLFALFFFPSGFGLAMNEIMRTMWGNVLNGAVVIGTVWNSLFFINDPEKYEFAARNLNPGPRWQAPIPVWSGWMMIAVVCGISLYMLHRKIRAHEVVR